MKKKRLTDIVMRICFGIMVFFMITIILRIFTRVVVVERLQVEDNALVNLLFFDQPQLIATQNGGIFRVNEDGVNLAEDKTDWAELYPFSDADDTGSSPVVNNVNNIFTKLSRTAGRIESSAQALTDKVSVYATDFLVGRDYFVRGMNRAEQLVGWNIADITEYNGVVTLPDGRLTEYRARCDMSGHAQSAAVLKDFCEELGCGFLYVQSPYDICKQENADICNVLDYSNQNADDLLTLLSDAGVECLDLRELLHADGMCHADAFYRTDHHWKAETGLWAAGCIAQYLNETQGFSIDTAMLNPDQFTYEVYPSWWLGSRGTKLTIDRVDAEDFTMIYPKYETLLRYEIPGQKLDKTGDFSITYDMTRRATTGGYSAYNYNAIYNHGDVAVNILTNLNSLDGKRIVIIKDSFLRVVIPFLSCADGVGEIDVLDERYFTGSTQSFIREKQPDIVIVWYSPNAFESIDWESHKSTFDFR